MTTRKFDPEILVIDGNEAAADVAYRTNELCVIYPITPSSTMGEIADQLSANKKENIWHNVPDIVEMQSEAGAIGAIHGALQTGVLATTFTASQGLLLMIPDMFRIAAELTPTVFHVASRTIAPQGMSIYPDHSDVMATRSTGYAFLCSANVQEAHDMAAIANMASLESRVPFLHFFDGFRTSHEVSKVFHISDDELRALIDNNLVYAHRSRRMCPENPSVRGVIYNSDIFFQQRETVNPFYNNLPETVINVMKKFGEITGRYYQPIEYFGAKDAKSIIIIMGSGAETGHETVAYMNKSGESVGVIKVRLFQPFPIANFLSILPETCENIAVLDRTKEPGADGEPLYQKISTIIMEAFNQGQIKKLPKIIGGRFGIGGKEFTPGMGQAIFQELQKDKSKNHFTVGIDDDVSKSSLTYDKEINIEDPKVIKAVFYGLGADGTVSANKNTIKIIGEETNLHVQGYFVYDSKKSGSRTVSHLRFGPSKIYSTYLISSANFIACHQFNFIYKTNVLEYATNGTTFLLNSPYSADQVWDHLPVEMQKTIIEKNIEIYVIDAYKVAKDNGMGERINTIMQTCFFALAKVLDRNDAIAKIKKAIAKTYANKGEKVINQNFKAVDDTLANLFKVEINSGTNSKHKIARNLNQKAPEHIKKVIGEMMFERGNELPVSSFTPDGTFPTETTKWEKRNVSMVAPVWNNETCVQCGRCSLVCPHSVIRVKSCPTGLLENAPSSFKSAAIRNRNDEKFILQIYPEDCTGCGLCVESCPVKNKALTLTEKNTNLTDDLKNIEFFEQLPSHNKTNFNDLTLNNLQFIDPMFEFSGACAGCGEAPYVKLVTKLFGERMIIANACGCSSVYGGNLPTTPWTHNKDGHGPCWSSSLFEDNAEFGFGFCLTHDKHNAQAKALLIDLASHLPETLVKEILDANQQKYVGVKLQQARVTELKSLLFGINDDPRAKNLLSIADHLVKQSIWSIGGDGWAYDIGFGGLDHVIASGRNINLLVLDTEVYSNTGGQASKATSRGSVAKFAANGKGKSKKDLGLMAMSYGDVYVASISLGANPTHAIKSIIEAESYAGPSLIIAYSHCIAHGIDMRQGMRQQELAVKSGYWPLYRYNPNRELEGLNPFQLDSKAPSITFKEYAQNENRFKILMQNDKERAEYLMDLAQKDINRRWKKYEKMA